MRPVLHQWPEKKRTFAFAPAVLVIGALTFLVLGFATQIFVLATLVTPFAAVGGAYALLGWPVVRRKDGKPLIDQRTKPWLFFVAFPLYALFIYPFAGLALTSVLPPAFTAYGPMAVALIAGGVGAYFTTGFPPITRDLRALWGRIPPRTRPWLSIPGSLVLTLFFYYLYGWLITTYLGVTWAPLVALPLAVVSGILLAVYAFGYPKPQRAVSEMVPRPPGNARPFLLLGTWLALGLPSAWLAGIGIQLAPLPDAYYFPSSLLVGFLLSFGIAAAVWGLPGRWAQLDDYEPGVSSEVRTALILPLALVGTTLVTVMVGFSGLDLLPSVLVGALVGVGVALWVTGALKAVRSYRLPEVPETVKPVLFFPLWGVVLVFVWLPLTFFLPQFFMWNLLGGVLVGFAVAFLVVQRDVLAAWQEERGRQKALKKELKALREGGADEA